MDNSIIIPAHFLFLLLFVDVRRKYSHVIEDISKQVYLFVEYVFLFMTGTIGTIWSCYMDTSIIIQAHFLFLLLFVGGRRKQRYIIEDISPRAAYHMVHCPSQLPCRSGSNQIHDILVNGSCMHLTDIEQYPDPKNNCDCIRMLRVNTQSYNPILFEPIKRYPDLKKK